MGEGESLSVPIGYIPEVQHTYQRFEANYGIVNEHNVAIGESTCSGVFGTNAMNHGGKALMSIDTLSRIALERSKSSRDAVQVMGDLAVEYGFYGAGSFEGSAESLLVGDPDELFIFHILPDDTNESAIWVAQRVPDDSVTVVANMFVIREVDLSDNYTFLGSDSVHKVAKRKGWWRESDGLLDFTKVYSDGEYAHKFYSGRRMWEAYRKFGNEFSDDYEDIRYKPVYPVSAKPAVLVGVQNLFQIHRSYYEGTKYDMTKGLAAGPFGNPDRYKRSKNTKLAGNWERSIAIYRTTQSHVVRTTRKGQGAVLFFGPHTASGTCYIPLAATAKSVPQPHMYADPDVVNHSSAYWAHKYVYNIARMNYRGAIQLIREGQDYFEGKGLELVKYFDESPDDVDVTILTEKYTAHATEVVEKWWTIGDKIMEMYGDNWLNDNDPIGYPDEWLEKVNFTNGPPPPPKHNQNRLQI